MLKNIERNRFWLLTGIETVILGIFFLYQPGFIADASPFHNAVNILDDTFPATVLVIVGTFTVIASCFTLVPNWHRFNVTVLQFVWTLYAVAFLIRDINDPRPPMIGIPTILMWAIVVRIFAESRWGDPGDTELVGGDPKRKTR